MHPDLIGQRYRVERAVGVGGMGTVWQATDEVLHRSVAVKQVGLLPGAAAEEGPDEASVFAAPRAAGDARVSRSGVVAGTPSYCAGERARGGGPGERDGGGPAGAPRFAAGEGHPPYRSSENAVGILHE